MTEVNRREFLRATCAAAGAVTAGGVSSLAFAQEPLKTVTVTHFGGPYQALKEIVGDPFERERLGRVIYETEVSVTALAKLTAQPDPPPFDIMMVARAFSLRAGSAGLVAPFTSEQVPRLTEVHPEAIVKGNIGVAMLTDGADIMYNKDRVSGRIDSWLDLWRPEFKGRLALPAATLSLPIFTLLIISKALSGHEKDIDGAFKKLKELRASVRVFFSDPVQANQLIERGEVIAAPQFSLRIANLMTVAKAVDRAMPKEGVPAVPYDLCIAKGSKNKDVAHRYINFVLSRPSQERLASRLLAPPVNRFAVVPKELSERLAVSDFKKLWFFDEDYVAANQQEWRDRWTREIQV